MVHVISASALLELEDAMATAEPSGAFGDGRLGNLEDCKKAGLLNSTGLFLGAHSARFGHFLFHNGEESLAHLQSCWRW
jgi:hypothetical protein